MTSDRKIEMILFDLDETLYPRNAGLMTAVGQRIHAYMEDRLGMPPQLATRLRKKYFEQYGTSLRGLQVHHEIDAEDYLEFVHDIPLADYIGPDPALQVMLGEIDARKAIFTNATAEHAGHVTRILGIEHFFERVIDVRANDFVGKPYMEAYRNALDLIGIPAQHCLLVEDSARNLTPGKELGMVTVLVGEQEPVKGSVDFHSKDVLAVGEIVRQLDANTHGCPGTVEDVGHVSDVT